MYFKHVVESVSKVGVYLKLPTMLKFFHSSLLLVISKPFGFITRIMWFEGWKKTVWKIRKWLLNCIVSCDAALSKPSPG